MIIDLHSIDGVLPELTVILDRNIPEEFGNEEYVWCEIWHVFKSLRGFEQCLGLHERRMTFEIECVLPLLFKFKAGVHSQLLASWLPEGLGPLCLSWVLLPLERLVAFWPGSFPTEMWCCTYIGLKTSTTDSVVIQPLLKKLLPHIRCEDIKCNEPAKVEDLAVIPDKRCPLSWEAKG